MGSKPKPGGAGEELGEGEESSKDELVVPG